MAAINSILHMSINGSGNDRGCFSPRSKPRIGPVARCDNGPTSVDLFTVAYGVRYLTDRKDGQTAIHL